MSSCPYSYDHLHDFFSLCCWHVEPPISSGAGSRQRKTVQQAEYLRDLRDGEDNAAPLAETEQLDEEPDAFVSITFPTMIWISQHGQQYPTSSACTTLDNSQRIPKGLYAYCEKQPAHG